MQLVVVSGFLGSGKTTLLLALARELCRDGRTKVAVIENEVGTVGIDDVLVAETGLPVREIYSGCICCSLRLDLVRTLLDLEREHAPDVVLLEPSGVASPAKVLSSLDGYGGEIDRRVTIHVVDAVRYQRVTDLSIPLIRDGLQVADVILVTKPDLVTPAELETVTTRLRAARPDLSPQPVVATDPAAVAEVTDKLLELVPHQPVPDPPPVLAEGPTPTVGTHQQELAFASPPSPEQLIQLLAAIQQQLGQAGCSLVGHLKAVLRSPGGGYLFASATALDGSPESKGRLPANCTSATLTINAIVYGVTAPILEQILASATAAWA